MIYVKIDKDTIKEIQETIIDLKPLRVRLVEIDKEIKEVEKEPDKIEIENMKQQRIDELKSEQSGILIKLNIK